MPWRAPVPIERLGYVLVVPNSVPNLDYFYIFANISAHACIFPPIPARPLSNAPAPERCEEALRLGSAQHDDRVAVPGVQELRPAQAVGQFGRQQEARPGRILGRIG